MNRLRVDLELALRVFVKRPILAGILVLSLTLALALGSGAAILPLPGDVMLRLLPMERPYRLVVIGASGADSGWTIPRSETVDPIPRSMKESFRDRRPAFPGALANARAFVSDCRNRPEPQGAPIERLC
jgi:hypothetical protein